MKIENHQSVLNYFTDLYTKHLFALRKYLHNQVSETLMFPENTLQVLNYKTEIFSNSRLSIQKICTHGCQLRFYCRKIAGNSQLKSHHLERVMGSIYWVFKQTNPWLY